jgi:succinate dehydrogenase/fumarate reductase flavoprotein subunit
MGRRRIRAYEAVDRFDGAADVIVCGFGGAGACAAIEARGQGAEVLLLERAGGFGGTTALSDGDLYLGGNGGTSLQRRHGFTDTSENMLAYLRAVYGGNRDEARLGVFVDLGVDHFEWLQAQGVRFNEEFWPDRAVTNPEGRSLQFTGNEKSHPFSTVATPVPRCHMPASAALHAGGQALMTTLAARVEAVGVDIRYDHRVTQLIQDATGRVRGVVATVAGREQVIEAKRGVVLCLGGFIQNTEMVAKHLPYLPQNYLPLGSAYDLGDGVLMGQAAGGTTLNMGEAFGSLAYYMPPALTFGIFVNAQGQRFINEDCYLSRMYHFASVQRDEAIYLFIDNKHFARPEMTPCDLAAVGETVAEVEEQAGLPPGSLQQTVEAYNRHAAEGQDPVFGKGHEWLSPFDTAPYALINYRLSDLYMAAFTLGGLEVRPTGEVLSVDGAPIPGLFAAGRTVAGVPRNSRGYASGSSVADATLFGRLAGRQAAVSN